jgi:TonB family protein
MCVNVSAEDIARSPAPPAESIASVAEERCSPILLGFRRSAAAAARSEGRELGEARLDSLVRSGTAPVQARLLARTRTMAAPPPPRGMSPPAPGRRSPSRRAQLATPVGRLITSRDYPAAAIRSDLEGLVRVRLDVSRRGRVTGCTILQTSGSRILDSTTCRLLRERARFTPGRNERGRSVADSVVAPVRWMIPND